MAAVPATANPIYRVAAPDTLFDQRRIQAASASEAAHAFFLRLTPADRRQIDAIEVRSDDRTLLVVFQPVGRLSLRAVSVTLKPLRQ